METRSSSNSPQVASPSTTTSTVPPQRVGTNGKSVIRKRKSLNFDPVKESAVILVSELRKWLLFKKLDSDVLRRAKLAYATSTTGFIVTTEDDVYSVGSNIGGALGIGVGSDEPLPLSGSVLYSANRVEALCGKKVKDIISCNMDDGEDGKLGSGYAWFAITGEGRVYSWGYAKNGVSGHPENPDPVRTTPTLVEELQDQVIVSISGGGLYVLALTSEGELFQWGNSEDGWPNRPTKVTSAIGRIKMTSISCGSMHAVAVSSVGEVYAWKTRMLTTGDQMIPSKVVLPNIAPIVKVVCGDRHCLALTSVGEIFSWGRNVNGQLGNKASSDRARDSSLVGPKVQGYKVELKHPAIDIAASPMGNMSACCSRSRFYIWGQVLDQGVINRPTSAYGSSSLLELFAHYFRPQVMPFSLKAQVTSNSNSIEETHTVSETLKQAFLSQSDPKMDITLEIEIDGKSIKAHKSILAMRSQYFRNMFSQNGWSEKNISTLSIGGTFRYKIIHSYILYLYSDDIGQISNCGEMMQLVALADYYCDSAFKNKCVALVKRIMGVRNVLEIFSSASNVNATELKDCAFEYIVENIEKFDEEKIGKSDLTRQDFVKLTGVLAKRRKV